MTEIVTVNIIKRPVQKKKQQILVFFVWKLC